MTTPTTTKIVESITSIKILSTWYDDHIKCASSLFRFDDQFEIKLSFWWVGDDNIAAMEYYESELAKSKLVNLFAEYITNASVMLTELRDYPELYAEGSADSQQEYDAAKELFKHFNITY